MLVRVHRQESPNLKYTLVRNGPNPEDPDKDEVAIAFKGYTATLNSVFKISGSGYGISSVLYPTSEDMEKNCDAISYTIFGAESGSDNVYYLNNTRVPEGVMFTNKPDLANAIKTTVDNILKNRNSLNLANTFREIGETVSRVKRSLPNVF